MSVDAHSQASKLMSDAERAQLMGDRLKAVQLYSQAAEFELQAFQRIPETRPKTRGLIAVSLVNLYRAAADLDEAARKAHYCLSLRDLPTFAVVEIKEIIAEIEQEASVRKDGFTLGNDYLDVALRGGTVGQGIVPLDLVTWKLQQLYRYVVRVMEWVDHRPFRGNSPPPANLLNLCTPMMTEPRIGSFRFEVRFQTPMQPILPIFADATVLTAENVTDGCLRLIDRVINNSPDDLATMMPNDQYRDFFLKLIRGLAPDGRDIREIAISRIGTGPSESLVLKPGIRSKITNYINSLYPPGDTAETHYGVLRELSLDKAWITLQEDSGPRKFLVRKGEIEGFDDIVGPFVNKRVRVSGYWRGNRNRKFYIRDIDLYDPQ